LCTSENMWEKKVRTLRFSSRAVNTRDSLSIQW
jgi:hypothetical protein